MKNKVSKIPVFGFAVIVAITLAFAFTACSGSGGGGKSINSATELKEYLDKQPANSPDQPIKVAMKANEMMLNDIAKVISEAGKYVSLDLSGSPLTAIPDEAFKYCGTLVGITIPNGVTSIGAFSYSLTSITVDSGNTNYASEGGILYNKAKTEIVYVPRGKNGNITIPNGVTSIGEQAFADWTSLTSVTIPNSVTSIRNDAFQHCTSLASVTIGNSVTSIEYSAFFGCSSLTSVTIPASVTSIGSHAFSRCTSLASVTFAENSLLTTIGANAFSRCTSLTSVTIPNSVTSIEHDAFSDCYSLTSITIPNSVTSIGEWAFGNCTSLTIVTFQGTIASDNFGGIGWYNNFVSPFLSDLRQKYLAGGIGTYTTTAPVKNNSEWTKQ